jgi:hypothetical protein
MSFRAGEMGLDWVVIIVIRGNEIVCRMVYFISKLWDNPVSRLKGGGWLEGLGLV